MVSSVEVLKGSAAAIYGSRGANGVILINLKSAKRLNRINSFINEYGNEQQV